MTVTAILVLATRGCRVAWKSPESRVESVEPESGQPKAESEQEPAVIAETREHPHADPPSAGEFKADSFRHFALRICAHSGRNRIAKEPNVPSS